MVHPSLCGSREAGRYPSGDDTVAPQPIPTSTPIAISDVSGGEAPPARHDSDLHPAQTQHVDESLAKHLRVLDFLPPTGWVFSPRLPRGHLETLRARARRMGLRAKLQPSGLYVQLPWSDPANVVRVPPTRRDLAEHLRVLDTLPPTGWIFSPLLPRGDLETLLARARRTGLRARLELSGLYVTFPTSGPDNVVLAPPSHDRDPHPAHTQQVDESLAEHFRVLDFLPPPGWVFSPRLPRGHLETLLARARGMGLRARLQPSGLVVLPKRYTLSAGLSILDGVQPGGSYTFSSKYGREVLSQLGAEASRRGMSADCNERGLTVRLKRGE
jgi:hypothetical protein